ncbi:hypothetical protein BWI17_10510 [Betaproteobacteria bacterium GR16-43]|nr:hypothetical protein BWI17_10510 [Betaproteobacteria bacterium GR16-43]
MNALSPPEKLLRRLRTAVLVVFVLDTVYVLAAFHFGWHPPLRALFPGLSVARKFGYELNALGYCFAFGVQAVSFAFLWLAIRLFLAVPGSMKSWEKWVALAMILLLLPLIVVTWLLASFTVM